MMLAAVLSVVGCVGSDDRSESVERRDSAGVSIIENISAEWERSSGAAWTVDPVPRLRIGSVSGVGGTDLTQVNFGTVLDDGSVVVVEGQDQTIRVFDQEGRLLDIFGGIGDGPGEFRGISTMARIRGDSMALHDVVLRRVQIMSAAGSFGRSIRLPEIRLVEGWFEDGQFLLMERPEKDSTQSEVRTATWTLHDATGNLVSEFVTLPFDRDPGGTDRVFPAPQRVTAVFDSTFVYGFPDRFEVQLFDPNGDLRRIIRTRDEAATVPETVAKRARDDARERGVEVTVLPTFPLFDAIEVGPDGDVWVRRVTGEEFSEAREEGTSVPRVWAVFRGDGRWLGDVEVPGGLEVLEVGSDFVLALRHDELDVPYVQLHELTKS